MCSFLFLLLFYAVLIVIVLIRENNQLAKQSTSMKCSWDPHIITMNDDWPTSSLHIFIRILSHQDSRLNRNALFRRTKRYETLEENAQRHDIKINWHDMWILDEIKMTNSTNNCMLKQFDVGIKCHLALYKFLLMVIWSGAKQRIFFF